MLFSSEKIVQGYKFNPFSGLAKDDFLWVFPGISRIRDFLDSNHWVFQIVGGSGAGKSTFLNQIQYYFLQNKADFYYYYIRNRDDCPPIHSKYRWLILDEANRIKKSVFLNNIVFGPNSDVRLILGSHMDHESWIKEKKWIKTCYLNPENRKTLESLIENRLQYASLDGKPRHRFSTDALDILHHLCGGSLRDAQAVCYELFLDENLKETIGRREILETWKKAEDNSIKIFRFFNLQGQPEKIIPSFPS